jgi:hypothetical protein
MSVLTFPNVKLSKFTVGIKSNSAPITTPPWSKETIPAITNKMLLMIPQNLPTSREFRAFGWLEFMGG